MGLGEVVAQKPPDKERPGSGLQKRTVIKSCTLQYTTNEALNTKTQNPAPQAEYGFFGLEVFGTIAGPEA